MEIGCFYKNPLSLLKGEDIELLHALEFFKTK